MHTWRCLHRHMRLHGGHPMRLHSSGAYPGCFGITIPVMTMRDVSHMKLRLSYCLYYVQIFPERHSP